MHVYIYIIRLEVLVTIIRRNHAGYNFFHCCCLSFIFFFEFFKIAIANVFAATSRQRIIKWFIILLIFNIIRLIFFLYDRNLLLHRIIKFIKLRDSRRLAWNNLASNELKLLHLFPLRNLITVINWRNSNFIFILTIVVFLIKRILIQISFSIGLTFI